MHEITKKLRKYEIYIRKAINSQMQGDFHSIFKGSGLEFEDIRPYQYGDDTRSIDWRSTAKYNQTFVKNYKETKEQTVYFLLDISASNEIGVKGKQKIDIAKEICAVLALVGLKESSKVGLISYTNVKEKFIKAGKGDKHASQLLDAIFKHKNNSKKTNLNEAIIYTLNAVKRKSIIIFISDFIDEGYEKKLKALAKMHDLIMIQISDSRETTIPKLGIIPVWDKENDTKVWVNTSSSSFRKNMNETYSINKTHLSDFCKQYQISYLSIDTEADYVAQLIKMFKVRNKSIPRV